MQERFSVEQLASDVKVLTKEYEESSVPYTMEVHNVQNDGRNDYVVMFYRVDLSPSSYTRKNTYDVLSTIEEWGKLRSAIKDIMRTDERGLESEGVHQYNYQKNPSVMTALHPYYSYKEISVPGFPDGQVMRYQEIFPYDD